MTFSAWRNISTKILCGVILWRFWRAVKFKRWPLVFYLPPDGTEFHFTSMHILQCTICGIKEKYWTKVTGVKINTLQRTASLYTVCIIYMCKLTWKRNAMSEIYTCFDLQIYNAATNDIHVQSMHRMQWKSIMLRTVELETCSGIIAVCV